MTISNTENCKELDNQKRRYSSSLELLLSSHEKTEESSIAAHELNSFDATPQQIDRNRVGSKVLTQRRRPCLHRKHIRREQQDFHRCDKDSHLYNPETFAYLRQCEIRKRPTTDYIRLNQHDLNPNMRNVLVDWMIEVSEEYKLQPETLLLSVSYMDRFLSKNESAHLRRSKLQLVGVTSLLIAAKYEEIYIPNIEDFVYITDFTYSREEILNMEWWILHTLFYDLAQPTTRAFLPYLLKNNHTSGCEIYEMLLASLCAYLAELILLDYDAVCLYLPSVVACSSVLLANYILFAGKPVWCRELQEASGYYRPSHLRECCIIMYSNLRKNTISTVRSSLTINEKYGTAKFLYISKHSTVMHFVRNFDVLPAYLFSDVLNSA